MKDPASVQARWREHFYNLLNREAEVDQTFINELRQYPVKHELADLPTPHEVNLATMSLKNGKATGPDGIPAELLKHGGPDLAQRLHNFIQSIWTEEQAPADLKDALIVAIHKKGDKADCGNYRGISLLSVVGKLFAKIISNRLTHIAEDVLPDTQCGFRPASGTIDMIFALRQVQEKCREQRTPLYTAFFDLTKAFDSVHRETLWKILSKYGCPDKLITMICLLHGDIEY